MAKKIIFGREARDKILAGIEKVYRAVSSTLGPRGSNVAIDRKWGAPIVLQDGVSVAREIELEDKFENVGAQLAIQASEKTNTVGDGTTGTVILTYAIVSNCLQNIAAGANAMMLRRGINKAVEAVKAYLRAKAIKLTDDQILQVATISAQNEEIGKLVYTAFNKLGKDAVITVEETKSTATSIEYKEGLQFDKGYVNPYFMTNEALREAVVQDARILIVNGNLSNLQDFFDAVDRVLLKGETPTNNLVVIADQFQPQIVAGLVMNKIKGVLNTIAIESPLHGDKRRAFLNDIAAITGASIVSEETGLSLRDLTIEDFGRADKVISTDDSTLIVGGKGNPSDVQTRIEQIKKEMENPDISDFDREKLQERLAKLTSGIAVINVGASSEVEMREKKERVIDAISAVKAAIEEGIVPGGETTLLRARDALSSELIQANSEERIGIDIVREALTLPFKRLMENSGYDPGESMALVRNAKFGQGIDVIDGELKDLVKAGIIDPVKVVRNIVENAASVSIMCMTTNTIIIEDEERKEQD